MYRHAHTANHATVTKMMAPASALRHSVGEAVPFAWRELSGEISTLPDGE